MLQSGLRVIGCVGAVAEDGSRVPGRTRIQRQISGFLAEANSVNNGLGPRLYVPETWQVVIRKHSENGRAKANRPQNLRTRGGQFLRLLLAHPLSVGEVYQQRHTGV